MQKQKSLDYQKEALARVSRTFALTIPLLPPNLSVAVGNAYLVCRIADTIEDDPGLDLAVKTRLFSLLVKAMEGDAEPGEFSSEAQKSLSSRVNPNDLELMGNSQSVIEVTRSLPPAQCAAIGRCVAIMSRGMERFQNTQGLKGLENQSEMDDYCYYVAGVVGEMLLDIFGDHSPQIRAQREELMPLARSFGQALQMTNILKDVWDDRERGACWLPRTAFKGMQECDDLVGEAQTGGVFLGGMRGLTCVTKEHLDRSLEFILQIPSRESGIRRFCLLSLGLSVLTLSKLGDEALYGVKSSGKVSRSAVKCSLAGVKLVSGCDWLIKFLYNRMSKGLPS